MEYTLAGDLKIKEQVGAEWGQKNLERQDSLVKDCLD
jgi:hypothetical protein